MAESKRLQPARVLAILGLLAAVSIALFMTVNARGAWDFVLPFRGAKVAALILVAHAIAVSTVLFQTVTHNRILTPSIMGFDTLYVLIQTAIAFATGAVGALVLSPPVKFAIEVAAMVAFSALLFRWLFSGRAHSLHLLVLVGIIFGVLFRSLSSFLQRLLDPDAFVALQDTLFANFNSIKTQLLPAAALALVGASVVVWRLLRACDVLALGRDAAIGLGIEYRRTVLQILAVAAVLVSVSTALVGPVTFFGLLVANMAYVLIGSHRHRLILPAAILLAIVCLVGGQILLEQLFAFDTALSIVIEFAGGLVFILLLIRGKAR